MSEVPPTATCPSCGHESPSATPFCPSCGFGNVRSQSPLAYTPPQMAEKILTSRAGLEGERKHVTILFADIKDSMELVAARDPEDAQRVLDPVLELMMGAVHRYEGIVNQVMGDGVMAIFGAPLAYEDHAVRACNAALAMQDAIRQYSEQLPASRGLQIRARIGLNSGEVVVRAIGNDLRMDYSAVGQTTHLAARMEQLALPGTILLMADTFRLVKGLLQVRPLGPMSVKGLGGPVEVFELLGAWPARTRWQARVTHGLTPFVGRQEEAANIQQASTWAVAGHGQLLAIVGDPGVGKSRLAWELAGGLRDAGWLVLETAAMSYGRTTAFRPLTELFRSYFGINDSSEPAEIRDAIARRLRGVDPALTPALPAFLDLLRVPFDDADWRNAEPAQRRERTLDAIRRLVVQESRNRPVLLMFEDLHWVDNPTQDMLNMLIEVLPAARVLVLVTYRPEYRHPWATKDCFAELRLDPLPRESAEMMLDMLLGNDLSVFRLKRLLLDRTEGNPFFLEECVWTLVASNALAGKRGAYRLTTELANVEVPETVHAVLAARIDRLGPSHKHLLQMAAVIGRHVPVTLLQAVAELPDELLREGLTQLQAAAFLVETGALPEPEYAFSHALTQEVVYRSILLERRRVVHGQVVDAMERHYGNRRDEHVELLGHHAVRGGRWVQAVGYLRDAGGRAVGRSEYAEAAAFFKESLGAAGHLPSGTDRSVYEIDIRFELRNVLWARGRLAEGLDFLHQAEPLAAALQDQRRLARLIAHKSGNYLVLGDNARARECGEEALVLARRLDDFALQVDANQFLGVLYTSLGDYRRALEHLETNAGSLVGERRRGRFGEFYAVHGQTWRVWCLAELGRFNEAAAGADQAMQIAEESHHPHNLVAAYWATGYLDRMRGRIAGAVDAFERGYAMCEAAGVNLWLRPSAAMLGHAYAWAGRLTEAVRLLELAVQPAENNVALAAWKMNLAETYLLAGRIDDAQEMAKSAVKLARERKEVGFAAYALRVLGAIAARKARVGAAETQYRESLHYAVGGGMLPLVARCHLGLAALERSCERGRQASEHEMAAHGLCQRMGINVRDLEPAEHVRSS
jgi:class 3 adenylate cyclase/tetratricopeptide (TPR) repeat protein